jgi:hypothetical protein
MLWKNNGTIVTKCDNCDKVVTRCGKYVTHLWDNYISIVTKFCLFSVFVQFVAVKPSSNYQTFWNKKVLDSVGQTPITCSAMCNAIFNESNK